MKGLIDGHLATRFCLLCMLVAFSTAGCGNAGKPEESSDTPSTVAAPSPAALDSLEKADAADGSADRVVSKCVTCKLHMEGKAEYSVSYGEYTVHLCSDYCKSSFVKEPEKALLNLE